MVRLAVVCAVLAFISLPAVGQERSLALYAPAEMAESGFLRHLLPRFSLKHGIRVALVETEDAADVLLVTDGNRGKAVFSGQGTTYRLEASGRGTPEHVEKFTDWLGSTAGQAAVAGFLVDGVAQYGPPSETAIVVAEITYDGDARDGEVLSLGLCGRCHVVGDANRMSGIGSTPSFAVLRTMPDWENRFVAFYVLKPHGAFTQVVDVTSPFAPETPSPIAPIEMTLDDLDNIVAYVAQITPADLGAPIEHQ